VTGFRDEATAMHDTLERHFGIEARWVDDQSYDTFENARNSVRMLHADGIGRVILVTRATHLMARVAGVYGRRHSDRPRSGWRAVATRTLPFQILSGFTGPDAFT
jgi:hypothetical protein